MRILLVSEHASEKFGGEAILPLHYFRLLRRRGYEVYLVVHSRTKDELQETFPNEKNIHYIEDTYFHQWMNKLGVLLPSRLAYFTTGYAIRFSSQLMSRRLVKKLVEKNSVNLVHQPIPVSPREPSLMYGLGVPVIIGPMNGGMNYAPAFSGKKFKLVNFFVYIARAVSAFIHFLSPGKRRAALLLVANQRTRDALPPGLCKNVIELVENGVDMHLWGRSISLNNYINKNIVKFIFIGRLVDWKAVDYLLIAFEKVVSTFPQCCLTIVGDGEESQKLINFCRERNILSQYKYSQGKVYFAGWQNQLTCSEYLGESDVFVLPSMFECGGAVVLEAMAAGVPVIATDWGGPADYLDSSCGILVSPKSADLFINGLIESMILLAQSDDLRFKLVSAAQAKVKKYYDWNRKIDRILEIYQNVIEKYEADRY